MLDALTLATFAPLVGEAFRVHVSPGEVIDAALVEARSLASKAEAPAGTAPHGGEAPQPREPFSLVFKGPPAPILPQRIYRIEHAALGAHDLFIVPIGRRDDGLLYEAIFT